MPPEFPPLPVLPVSAVVPDLLAALERAPGAVLEAPPGAGKSTLVPLALLSSPLGTRGRILMLEPRRLAARAVACRMSATLGESVGTTVGYRTRLETRVGPATRIEVITEGILVRLLDADPALEDVAVVIFDEFHERSLNSDLGLALCLDARRELGARFRVLVMSATLDGASVASLLGDVPVIRAEGRQYPVEVRHADRPPEQLIAGVAATIRRAAQESPGDALVFLPGLGEIRRTATALEAAGLPADVRVLALHGDLAPAEQDAALDPAPPGMRKVILSTAIAETSLTIDGVRIVIDAGLARRSLFDPVTGMSGLVTVRASRASLEQRRGRAGRTASGVCYRLWPESAERSLAAYTPAEIEETDLAPLALTLAAWGTPAAALTWLTPPPAAQLAAAESLLVDLGAIDRDHRITPLGRRMAGHGLHPRLARLLLAGEARGARRLAAELAALLTERDIVRGVPGQRDTDLRKRLLLLRGESVVGLEADRGALARVRELARRYAHDRAGSADTVDRAGALLAEAYPDRVAGRRAEGLRFLLANGRGATFTGADALAREPFLVVPELDGAERDARIFLAAPVSRHELEEHLAERIETRATVTWDARSEAVSARRERRLGAVALESGPWEDAPAEAVMTAMLEGLAGLGLGALPFSRDATALRHRLCFVAGLPGQQGRWPDASDAGFMADLRGWLEGWLPGITRRSHLARLDMMAVVRGRLTYALQTELENLAPTHFVVPSGSRLPIDYETEPALTVRLQEMFGLAETPRVGGNRVPLLLKLTSPAGRPVQVTRDLASFWSRGYAEVRKELKGRYPKHYWPDDPLTALPTARARPRP
jgi:ATP-dependent helicase HrpB